MEIIAGRLTARAPKDVAVPRPARIGAVREATIVVRVPASAPIPSRHHRRPRLSTYSPPRRGGREARARQGEASREDRRNISAELTTPALRATPPLRGGECVPT